MKVTYVNSYCNDVECTVEVADNNVVAVSDKYLIGIKFEGIDGYQYSIPFGDVVRIFEDNVVLDNEV